METLVKQNEALYRTMHNTVPGYQINNWGILTLHHWLSFVPEAKSSILEVGCGNGKTCKLLTDMRHDVTGMDLVPGSYDREGYEFVKHDITDGSFPFVDDTFDLAISFDVLEHIEPECVPHALSEMFRVAKRVLFIVPVDTQWMGIKTDATPSMNTGVLHRTARSARWWYNQCLGFTASGINTHYSFDDDNSELTRNIICAKSK